MEINVVVRRLKRAVCLLLLASASLLAVSSSSAAQTVSLTWSPSPDENVAGYNVYYGVASRVYTNKVDVGAVTNATVSGLREGVTYYFAATAYNILGVESDYSEEVFYAVPGGATNFPPTLNTIVNLTINEDAGKQTVALAGISSGSSTENQTLVVTAKSSNTGLIPDPAVAYTSPNQTGTLSFTPVANAFGTATITVTVNDGGASNNVFTRTFSVTVNSVNDLPAISTIANQVLAVNSNSSPISFIVSDTETAAASLTVSATSSAPGLIPAGNIVFGGSGANRTVTLKPIADQTGTAIITISVSDGVATISTTFQLSVLGAPAAPENLTIQINGLGSVVSPKKAMIEGKVYSLTAVPEDGQEFAGWSGGVRSPYKKVSFVMHKGMLIQATFVPNPYTAGSYNGLLYEDDDIRVSSAGYFTLKVSKHGGYSGQVQVGSLRKRFSGKLDLSCQATNHFARRGSTPLELNLSLGTNELAGHVFGRLTDGNWVAHLQGDLCTYSRTNPTSLAGTYTMAIPNDGDATQSPEGYGYGTIKVSSVGKTRFSGSLADGTKVTQSAMIAPDGAWPLYVSLYRGQGALVSWMNFTNRSKDDLNGTIRWIKSPGAPAKNYAGGFDQESKAIGSRFVRNAGTNVLNAATAEVKFEGDNLTAEFSNSIAVSSRNVVSNQSDNRLSLKFSAANGSFTGKVTDPSTGRAASFRGVVLQKAETGYGYLLSDGLSSRVKLDY
ncbi:MAG TPA: fibronectin type III domain-containing protein [Verrucomicrobiae bacterium]|jgi:Fibronectin type III domain.